MMIFNSSETLAHWGRCTIYRYKVKNQPNKQKPHQLEYLNKGGTTVAISYYLFCTSWLCFEEGGDPVLGIIPTLALLLFTPCLYYPHFLFTSFKSPQSWLIFMRLLLISSKRWISLNFELKFATIKNKYQVTWEEMLDAYERHIIQDVTFILF